MEIMYHKIAESMSDEERLALIAACEADIDRNAIIVDLACEAQLRHDKEINLCPNV